MRQYAEVGHVEVAKSSGRPRKLSEPEIEYLTNYAAANNFATNKQLRDALHDQGTPMICENTATNYLKVRGISSRIAAQKPLLSQEAKAFRVGCTKVLK